MKKRMLILLLAAVLLSGCSRQKQVYTVTWLDAFDTVVTLRGYDVSEKAFTEQADQVHEKLLHYHALFDVYTPRDIPNLYTVNAQAGIAPVPVEPEILALLHDCADYYDLSHGRVNAAMGAVLELWHQARTDGLEDPAHAVLPDGEALEAAASHCSWDTVILDDGNQTVFLSDSLQRLDVGAIAKGWSGQRIAESLPEGYMLNLGGNICARGSKPDGSPWVIGVQDPDSSDYFCTVDVYDGSAVTSGDYQRFYEVDGQRYHHIIDPDTRMPSAYFRSVTILHPDSGLADCLSTALFLMPLEEGRALAEATGAEAMWIDAAGNITATDGFPAKLP